LGSIDLNPIGIVHSDYHDPAIIPKFNHKAVVEIYPDYQDALYRIEEHSHLWILSWFHKARRNFLRTVPARVNPDAPEYGVFGLRSAGRPNPIALSLVRLAKVENNLLHVIDLDSLDGSPVLDIKPYFENDVVFSPVAPYFHPKREDVRYDLLYKRAFRHHQEECPGLLFAIRVAWLALECFEKLNQPTLKLEVQGSLCLADTLQGLFNARLANPTRCSYKGEGQNVIRIQNGHKEVIVTQLGEPTMGELKDISCNHFLKVSQRQLK
jgi:tRNA-Thr(GGU) m(6)t(6)A37 methyltransferase TsaA